MKIKLQIPPGIDADDTSFSAQGRWHDGNNVRFWRGSWQVIGGWELFSENGVNGVCRKVFPWTDVAGSINVGLGTNTNLHVAVGGQLYDITPLTFVPGAENGAGGAGYGTGTWSTGYYSEPSTTSYFPLTWSLSAFGQIMIANPRGQTIFQWENNTAVLAQPVPNAPAVVSYALVTPQRQIMALGCNQEIAPYTFNPLCIRWCDIENQDDWTTSAANNAGEYILTGGGRLVAGIVVGQYEMIWTDMAVYLATFVGQPGQTYTFVKQADSCGLIGPNAMAVIQGVAYWISPDQQFWRMAPGGAPQIIPCPVRDQFLQYLAFSQADKITASSNSTFGEIRWDYPDTRDNTGNPGTPGVENSRYISVSVLDGSWFKGVMDRPAYVDAGPTPNPIGVDYLGAIYYQERGHSANGSPLTWSIESADQYLGQGAPMLQIQGMYPDFQDQQGAVNMQVTTRLYPQDKDYMHGPWALNPMRNQRTFQASGRVARVKFYGSSSPAYARGGSPVFEVIPTGVQ